jgi:uncharacterized protein (DUF362 family)
MNGRDRHVVTLSHAGLRYADAPPFGPPNPVYEAIENLFRCLGLDLGRLGTAAWNPLGDLIEPGDHVVIKPNLVASKNLHEEITGQQLLASSVHGSVLRPVLDYALRAAGSKGRVRVVDTPLEGCEIGKVAGPLGIFDVIGDARRKGHNVEFLDARHFCVRPRFLLDDVPRFGHSLNLGLLVRRRLPGDPLGYRTVDLGRSSFFASEDAPPVSALRFHRSHYRTPLEHHTGQRHEYSVPNTVLDADVVINLAKLKTHKKTGVTLALKGVVGLTNEKYWLPHFTEGDPTNGGDEFDRPQTWRSTIVRKLSRIPIPGDHSVVMRAPRKGARPSVMDGSWQGNDTLWRTILDLNRVVFFADKEGRLRGEPRRRSLVIIDGIVAGEGEGPLGTTPVDAGVLIGGYDPVLVDLVATRLIGFSPEVVPTVRRALDVHLFPSTDAARLEQVVEGSLRELRFRAPSSWPSLPVPRSPSA